MEILPQLIMRISMLQFLHDYSTRVPLPLSSLEKNFNSSLAPLSFILSCVEPATELDKLKLVIKANEYFCRGNNSHYPCIQSWDVSIRT